MLDAIHHFASRRLKRDAPPLEGEEGEPLETLVPPLRSWCRITLGVSLVPPPTGQIITYAMTRRTLRATLHAPKTAVCAVTLAALGSVPWIRELVMWCIAHWK